jgi:hypothetical protein
MKKSRLLISVAANCSAIEIDYACLLHSKLHGIQAALRLMRSALDRHEPFISKGSSYTDGRSGSGHEACRDDRGLKATCCVSRDPIHRIGQLAINWAPLVDVSVAKADRVDDADDPEVQESIAGRVDPNSG